MITENQYQLLIDYDSGSCRDITFSNLSSDQMLQAIFWLNETYEIYDITGYKDENYVAAELLDFFKGNYQGMDGKAKSDIQVINHIQFCISKNINNSYFFELTFFPEHIRQQENSILEINKWLKILDEKLMPEAFYIRYENPSWNFGDESADSGVIVSKTNYA